MNNLRSGAEMKLVIQILVTFLLPASLRSTLQGCYSLV